MSLEKSQVVTFSSRHYPIAIVRHFKERHNMKSIKGSASLALERLRLILANDPDRKARLEVMADNIRRKAIENPRRIVSGDSLESLLNLGKEKA